jgi:hypothetical protein
MPLVLGKGLVYAWLRLILLCSCWYMCWRGTELLLLGRICCVSCSISVVLTLSKHLLRSMLSPMRCGCCCVWHSSICMAVGSSESAHPIKGTAPYMCGGIILVCQCFRYLECVEDQIVYASGMRPIGLWFSGVLVASLGNIATANWLSAFGQGLPFSICW